MRATTDGVAAERRFVTYPSSRGREVSGDLVLPAATGEPTPAVVLVHGGAWQGGSRKDFASWADALAAEGVASLAIDYRLAAAGLPSWPLCLDDVVAGVTYLRSVADEVGVDSERLGALGTSAGAHLVATAVASGALDLSRVVLVNGGYDLVAQYPLSERSPRGNAVRALLGRSPDEAPELYAAASPLALLDSSPAAATRWLVVVSSADVVLPPPLHGVPFAAALKARGDDVELMEMVGAAHLWITSTPLGEEPNSHLFPRVVAFLGDKR